MTRSEWAAWVQAVGSVVAIVAAAGIAIWQSKKQHESGLALHRAEKRHARLETAKTLLALSRNCAIAAKHFANELGDRESVHLIAAGAKHFDFEELEALQNGIASIPVYQLPSELVNPAMVLAATLRQLRQAVEIGVREHRTMDATAFEEFFKRMNDFSDNLELTQQDISAVVQDMEKSA